MEIKNVEGEWIELEERRKGEIVVFVGDMLEIWSSGLFPRTLHRVKIPEDEGKRKKSRLSLLLFILPDNDVFVEPLIPSQTGKEYEATKMGDYIKSKLSRVWQKEYE